MMIASTTTSASSLVGVAGRRQQRCCRGASARCAAVLRPRAGLLVQQPVGSAAAGARLVPAQARPGRSLLQCRASAAAGGGGGGGGSGGGGEGSGSSDKSGGGGGVPHPLRLWTFGYAALLALGGVAGYVKAGSTKSLTSALGSALILGLSARTMVGAGAKGPVAVCLAVALLLSVVMANRYQRSRKVMPAGVAAGASIAMSLAYAAALAA